MIITNDIAKIEVRSNGAITVKWLCERPYLDEAILLPKQAEQLAAMLNCAANIAVIQQRPKGD